jgi:hypothetical protein
MHLEHFDEDEDLCVFEVDGPPTWDARDDGVDDRLAGQRVVIAYFEFDLVLYARDIKSEDTYVSRGSRPLIPTGRTGREVFRKIGGETHATVHVVCCGILRQERLQDALRERLDLGCICDARIRNRCQAVRVPVTSQTRSQFRIDG